MKQPNMSDLFEKLNDLKTLFHYGQKLIPIIQSLIDFMRETVPLLENINNSIAESTSKIPKASNQINNVTSATEMATTEILDIVDVISNDIFKAEKLLKEYFAVHEQKKEKYDSLKTLLAGNEPALAIVEELLVNDEKISLLTPLFENFQKVNTDAYNITLSLQVQDITAQQLAAVNHLIQSVQDKLSSLITNFNDAEFKDNQSGNLGDINKIDVPEGVTFDPDARYNKETNKQNIADELVNNKFSNASQEEIDKLFS